MKSMFLPFRRPARLIALLGSLFLLQSLLNAAQPSWWADRGVLNGKEANDYAAVNQGQAKFMAVAAIAELNDHLTGGAGDYLNNTLLPALSGTGSQTNDYSALNLGQLKSLAKPFYDRLIAAGFTNCYPWAGKEGQTNDYAMANIGQVKQLFSFDLSNFQASHPDNDGDGLPDDLDFDGDGVPNGVEFLAGTNPRVPDNPVLKLEVNVISR